MNTLQVEVRTVYGRDVIYPVNTLAIWFARLLEQQSFTERNLEHLTRIGQVAGFTIEEVTRTRLAKV